MKDKNKKNRLCRGEFKLKVDLDIIENELSYSQAAKIQYAFNIRESK